MMIEINLLPKEYQKKSFDFSMGKTGLYGIIGAAAVIALMVGITFWQNYKMSSLDEDIQKAQQRSAMLQKDIQFVDALTDVKAKITRRMKAVERLDSHRSTWVRLLEELARNVPEFVWVGKFEEKPVVAAAPARNQPQQPNAQKAQTPPPATEPVTGPTVRQAEIEGFAFTLNALASFMIKMMRSDYFDEVELVSTEELLLQEKKVYNFNLSFNVHYLSDEELRNLVAAANLGTDDKSKTTHKSLN